MSRGAHDTLAAVRRLRAWIVAYRLDSIAVLRGSNTRVSFTCGETGVVYDVPWTDFWNDNALHHTMRGWEGVPLTPRMVQCVLHPAARQLHTEGDERMSTDKTATVLEYVGTAQAWARHHDMVETKAYISSLDERGVEISARGGSKHLIPWSMFWAPIPGTSVDEVPALETPHIAELPFVTKPRASKKPKNTAQPMSAATQQSELLSAPPAASTAPPIPFIEDGWLPMSAPVPAPTPALAPTPPVVEPPPPVVVIEDEQDF